MIERDHADLSVARQCDLLGLARSTLCYRPVEANAQDLTLMRRLDEPYTRTPFYGVRRVAGRSKSAAPLEELCGAGRRASMALRASPWSKATRSTPG